MIKAWVYRFRRTIINSYHAYLPHKVNISNNLIAI